MRENKNSREESGAQDMCGCGHCHGQTEKAEKERKIGHGHEDADRDGDGCACGHCHESGEHGENKKETAVLCVSAALLAIAILATKVFFTDLPQWAVPF